MLPEDVAPLIGFAIFSFCIAMIIILRGPLGKALARRIDGTAGADEARAKELERRVAELEARESRVGELEERLDFAERLLTQHEEARLPQGRG